MREVSRHGYSLLADTRVHSRLGGDHTAVRVDICLTGDSAADVPHDLAEPLFHRITHCRDRGFANIVDDRSRGYGGGKEARKS